MFIFSSLKYCLSQDFLVPRQILGLKTPWCCSHWDWQHVSACFPVPALLLRHNCFFLSLSGWALCPVWSKLVIFDFTSCNKHCVLKANTMLWQTICIVWRVCVSPPSTPQKLTHYIEQISLLSDAIIISQEQMLTLSITIAAFLAFSFLDIRLQIRYSFARVAPSLVKLFVLLWIIFRPIVKPNRVEEEKFPLPQGQLLASTTLPLFWGLL